MYESSRGTTHISVMNTRLIILNAEYGKHYFFHVCNSGGEFMTSRVDSHHPSTLYPRDSFITTPHSMLLKI